MRAGDCQALQACDLSVGKCGSACGGGSQSACSGGCCQAGTCAAGTANGACGASGGACVACVGGTPTCGGGVCTAACGAQGDGTCAGGFCCSAGACVDGSQPASCGYSGACADCRSSAAGMRCETGSGNGPWFCGCDGASDCAVADPGNGTAGQACDTGLKQCTSQCGAAALTPCNGGCCSSTNGTCRAGARDDACGGSGAMCVDCVASCGPGPICLNASSCGCTGSLQCGLDLLCGMRNTCANNACQ
jgi:hypothetical protein